MYIAENVSLALETLHHYMREIFLRQIYIGILLKHLN